MKKLKLIALLALASVFGRPPGLCTANAASDDIATLKEQVAALQEQLAAKNAAPQIPTTTELLIKGAGLENADDVTWRIQAGLDPAQAVEAAVSQLAEDKRAAKEAGKKKEAK
jgi:hypothetical protein